MRKIFSVIWILVVFCVFSACSTTKSKDEIKGFKKFYHNTTAKFNGFFNAEEIMRETMLQLQEMHVDNYNDILSVYDYVEVENPQAVSAELDRAIEKVSTVATIHDISNYVDDCYVLIGKAQYLKHDYIGAEETFQYFEEMFDPKNPYGRVYSKSDSRTSGRKSKKELRRERKQQEKDRKEAQKEREKEREEAQKSREEERKARLKKAKERKKNSKRGRSRSSRDDQKEEASEDKRLTREEREKLREQEAALEELQKLQEEEEERRKELEEEKEDDYKAQGKGAIWKDKTAYTLGLYWLARTYIETERYSSAKYVIDRLESTIGLHKDIERRLPAVRADLYIKTGEYNRALVELDEAINVEKDKQKKARYAFIRAQIFEKQNNTAMAFGEYSRARKLSPGYELKFNAELNELKLSYSTGRTSMDKALNSLDKMLSENKNDAFRDQIYFTKAQIYLESGNVDEAIASFEKSIGSTGGNAMVKLEAYYKLAELLFDQGLYTRAKENYDMALKNMPLTDPRYKKVEKLSANLDEIAGNISVVRLQDSLLALSLKSEEELKELAEDLLLKRAEEGTKDLAAKENSRKSNIITSNRQLGTGRSNFFAYNPLALNQGKTEFKRVWGDRVLEDNWRRSLRTDATLNSVDNIEESTAVTKDFTDEEIRAVLKDVPRSDVQKRSANLRIQNALFELGILFRERLRNYEKSAEVLERLIREYPEFEKRDEALFYLYLSYYDMNQMAKANSTVAKMQTEYPDSKFTKLATDPNYAKTLLEQEMSIENYYTETYRQFEEGNYAEVIERSNEKNKLFPGSEEYGAKFELLKAMSYGKQEGKERYIGELEKLVRAYPKTPEEVRAKEILRFLKGDREAFDQILYDEALDKFEVEHEKLHYVFIVVYDLNQRDFDQAKIDINNYNKKYHRFDNLKTSNIYLNQENKAQIILVRSFDDKKEAMKYYEGVGKNREEFIKNSEVSYELYPATQKNYREVIKQQGISNYRVFFEENYLNK